MPTEDVVRNNFNFVVRDDNGAIMDFENLSEIQISVSQQTNGTSHLRMEPAYIVALQFWRTRPYSGELASEKVDIFAPILSDFARDHKSGSKNFLKSSKNLKPIFLLLVIIDLPCDRV